MSISLLSFDWFVLLETPIRAALIGSVTAVITTLGALVGVWRTLSWNRRKHREDAEFVLRKDVYLTSSDAFAEVALVIATVILPETRMIDALPSIQRFSGALGKIYITGERRIRDAVAVLQSEVMRLYSALSLRKIRLDGMTAELERLSKEHALFDRMQTIVAGAPEKFEEWKLRAIQNDLEKNRGETSEVFGKRLRDFGEAQKFAQTEILKLAPAFTDVVIAFRRDLRLPPEDEWFHKNVVARMEEGRLLQEQFLKQLSGDETLPSCVA